MAHEIEIVNGTASAFFTKHEAWHKLGIVLDTAPNTDEAYKHSGLEWTVEKVPMVAQKVVRDEVNGTEETTLIETDSFALIRDRDNRVLGTSKGQYTIYQNKQAFEWCRPLVESGYWTYEAGGSLKMGETCWILLKQAEVQLIPNDTLKEYLLFNWSHNGKLCNIIQPTTIRVVCNNTLQLSLAEGGAKKIRHMSGIFDNTEKVKEFFNLTREAFDAENVVWKKMIDFKMTDERNHEFIDGFVYDDVIKDNGNLNVKKENLAKFYAEMVFGKSSMNAETKGTLYGTYNAIQEGIEHYVGNGRVKDRGFNILFGQGRQKVERLNEMAMKLIA